MSFIQTLKRILTIYNGDTPPNPPVIVTNVAPKNDDSKELLALKWEKIIKEIN
jgi:hypothetical protein